MWMGIPVHQLPPHLPIPPAATFLHVLLPWLPMSAPPTSLDECFFHSLVVGLSYSSIFWQFWLLCIFKFVVILLLVVRGSKTYLPTPPSWLEPELCIYLFLLLILEREEVGREKVIDFFFHLFMHSVVNSFMRSDQGLNPQPWCIRTML